MDYQLKMILIKKPRVGKVPNQSKIRELTISFLKTEKKTTARMERIGLVRGTR